MIIKLSCSGKNQDLGITDNYLIIDEIDHVDVGRIVIEDEDQTTFNKRLATYNYVNVTPHEGDTVSCSLTHIKAYKKEELDDLRIYNIVTDDDVYLCNNNGQTIERLIPYGYTGDNT